MTTCKTIHPRLTAYLDGELTDDHGSVVRGHLRECAACRQMASDEAALRDGLRALPSLDPPSSLWSGVQAQLAAAEVADARKPRWRHAVARWVRWASAPRLATGVLVTAAAVVVLYWRAARVEEPIARGDDPPPFKGTISIPPQKILPAHQTNPAPAGDVTADLLAEPAQTTASHDLAIEELMKLVSEARGRWSNDRSRAFDTRIAALRTTVERAEPGRPQQRAQRALIRYLQDAVVHGDDVVFASGGAR